MAGERAKGEWLPYAGLLMAVAGMVYQGGGMSRDLQDARANIVAIEQHNAEVDRQREDRYREVTDRLTRLETKMDALNEHRSGK